MIFIFYWCIFEVGFYTYIYMKEEILQYLWRTQFAKHNRLFTTDRREIHIISPGLMHHDAGPDFKQAVIRIDDMIWAGDVEIHVNGSDWYKHKHHRDDKYLSVILHVVYNHDQDVVRKDQELIPTLELKKYIPPSIIAEYEKLTLSTERLACGQSIGHLPPLFITSVVSSVALDRLIRRKQQFFRMLKQCADDWDELTYRVLGNSFGFKVNSAAFELLVQSLPYRIIEKHISSQLQVYALVFGQAGLLNEDEEITGDDYYKALKSEYDYLRYKYQLSPINPKLWNLLRLRPPNFPAIRLAQFSEMLYCIPDIFHELIENSNAGNLPGKTNIVHPHAYWNTHFQFGKTTQQHACQIGKEASNLLIINTIIPLKFTYACFTGDDAMQSECLTLLEATAGEDNHITRLFKQHKFQSKSALTSQALLELYSTYCKGHRCHACPIGQYVVTHLSRREVGETINN